MNSLEKMLEETFGAYEAKTVYTPGNILWGTAYEPQDPEDRRSITITRDGKELFERYPDLLSGFINKTPDHIEKREPLAVGRHAEIYEIHINGDTLVEKEYGHYNPKKNATSQSEVMAELNASNIPGFRAPLVYAAIS